MNWKIENIPLQQGKLAIVTGANSGLGYETAKALALKGAEIVMACRNQRKAEEAANWIREEIPAAKLHVMHLDLSSLDTVHEFAGAFHQRFPKLDLLINNAGLMAIPLRRTAQDFEMQLGTNHLGHFALTGLLLPALEKIAGARVVQVSSLAYTFGQMDFKDLNWKSSRYNKWRAYGRSKLSNLLFAQELDRRFQAAQWNASAIAAHPGYAATNLQARGKAHGQTTVETWFMNLGNGIMAQSQAMGALPQLYAATAVEARGGAFYGPDGWFGMRGYPKLVEPKAKLCSPEDARQLWEHSEALTGVKFAF